MLNGRRRLIVLFVFFATAALFPMVVLNHVSEAHAYNSMPFFCVLAGVGLGTVWAVLKGKRWRRIAFAALVVVFLAAHYGSTQSKTRLMVENGEQAAMLLSQIEPYVGDVFRVPEPSF